MFWSKQRKQMQAELIDQCSRAEERARQLEAELEAIKRKPTAFCSFCGKSQHQVRKIVAGPTVFICDGCIDDCRHIVEGGTA